MKRNRGGERDLDHIIMASIRGLDRALLEYPVKAGLIFCLDRTFDETLNSIILEKAIAYRHRLHVVNVFVWPARGEADRAPHTHARQGYALVGWTRGGLRFCAVGDVAAADLGVLADLLRNKV